MPRPPLIVLVDDLRSFLDDRPALVARTSADGVTLLDRHRGEPLAELWLDHDLGGDDTIWPVVELLERAAFDERPFDVGSIFVHSSNPPGAGRVVQALRRWGYNVRAVSDTASGLGHRP